MVLLTALAACRFGFGDEPRGDGAVGAADGPDGSDPTPEAVVYVHGPTDLYAVDPDTFGMRFVGAFGGACASDSMTDIAVDRTGDVIAISFTKLYRVDPMTAGCELLGLLPRQFNGLTFMQSPSDPDADVLIGTTLTGDVWLLDVATGGGTRIGRYGGGIASAGDVVSVRGFGTIAAARQQNDTTDWIARVDPFTGDAVMIGDTGLADVFGIAYWGGSLYGFTDTGTFVLIDPTTGAATVKSTGTLRWWGAGVTTLASVAPP